MYNIQQIVIDSSWYVVIKKIKANQHIRLDMPGPQHTSTHTEQYTWYTSTHTKYQIQHNNYKASDLYVEYITLALMAI